MQHVGNPIQTSLFLLYKMHLVRDTRLDFYRHSTGLDHILQYQKEEYLRSTLALSHASGNH